MHTHDLNELPGELHALHISWKCSNETNHVHTLTKVWLPTKANLEEFIPDQSKICSLVIQQIYCGMPGPPDVSVLYFILLVLNFLVDVLNMISAYVISSNRTVICPCTRKIGFAGDPFPWHATIRRTHCYVYLILFF